MDVKHFVTYFNMGPVTYKLSAGATLTENIF